MKRTILTALILTLSVTGFIAFNVQSGEGLVKDIQYIVLPDPMEHNRYDEGQCTHYIFKQIKTDGNMIEKDWSDAEHWAKRAEEDGYTVNAEPAEGAILQTSQGDLGHVAYIETVNDDGSIEISEMNRVEPYEVTERTIGAGDTGQYRYIHPKENPYDDSEDAA